MVCCAKSDLEDRLRELDEKLQSLSKHASSIHARSEIELQQIQEERQSTEQCLVICAEFSEHIEKVGSQIEASSGPEKLYAGVSVIRQYAAKQALSDLLGDFKSELASASNEFNSIIERLDHRQNGIPSRSAQISGEDAATMQQVQEERNSTAQCLTICVHAAEQSENIQSNIFEDISSGDDSQQFAISSIGQLITARRITTGSRSLLMLGQLSGDTIRQASRDHFSSTAGILRQKETTRSEHFQSQYGVGHQLKAEEIEVVKILHG